jgi:two-component system, LytTR family, sensor kinase
MSNALNVGELLNLVGLSTGVVLYAMLLAMALRPGRRDAERHVDPLLLATAVLGLIWNVCALPAYQLSDEGLRGPFPFLTATGFGALGLLPAVVVHSVVRGGRATTRARTGILVIAYVVSAAGTVLQCAAAARGDALPSPTAMRLLTYTFVGLIVPLAFITRREPGARRAMWMAALAVFAVSALHLSEFRRGEASWPVELVGHHASLPLAFAMLYQDYPFALADLFLKRALALLALVTLAFVAVATLGEGSPAFAAFVQSGPRDVGALVVLWVTTALIYPRLRRTAAWFVDRVVLDRADYGSLKATIARRIQTQDDVRALLSDVCDQLAPAMSSRGISWTERRPAADEAPVGPTVTTGGGLAARVVLPVSEPPTYVLRIAGLTGGRRVLSDDVAMLEAVAVLAARRIDAIRMTGERHARRLREEEIGRLASEAELRSLRAQINPHFLFNALTTIGYLIEAAPARALQTLLRLTSLLRAVLRSEGEYTTLGRELALVEDYLDIERARFDERLQVQIDVAPRLRDVRVPPFLVQPLVENAVKHGIAQRLEGGEVLVRAVESHGPEGTDLLITVADTGAGTTEALMRRGRERGLGLRNVERRLQCQYGATASCVVRTSAGQGTTVDLRLPMEPAGRKRATAPVAV